MLWEFFFVIFAAAFVVVFMLRYSQTNGCRSACAINKMERIHPPAVAAAAAAVGVAFAAFWPSSVAAVDEVAAGTATTMGGHCASESCSRMTTKTMKFCGFPIAMLSPEGHH